MLLLDAQAKVNAVGGKHGATALHDASQQGHALAFQTYVSTEDFISSSSSPRPSSLDIHWTRSLPKGERPSSQSTVDHWKFQSTHFQCSQST